MVICNKELCSEYSPTWLGIQNCAFCCKWEWFTSEELVCCSLGTDLISKPLPDVFLLIPGLPANGQNSPQSIQFFLGWPQRQIHIWCSWSRLQVTDTTKERKYSLCQLECGDSVELVSLVLSYDEHHITQPHWKRISRLRFPIWKLTAVAKLGTWIILHVNRNYSKILWQ